MSYYYSLRRFAKGPIVGAILLILPLNLWAQTFTDSNLPIVVVSTDVNTATNLPFEIRNDPRVLGNMKIIWRPDGGRNYLSGGARLF